MLKSKKNANLHRYFKEKLQQEDYQIAEGRYKDVMAARKRSTHSTVDGIVLHEKYVIKLDGRT